MSVSCNDHTPLLIRSVLGGRPPVRILDGDRAYRHAGVLIPLFQKNGVCKVLFIERTQHVPHHKGQIAFPGGRREETDSSIMETVLREVKEEIGVAPSDIEILGRVDDALTVTSNFRVSALVGRVPYPYDFTIESGEVERIVTVPLAVFHPQERRYRRDAVSIQGVRYNVTTYEYQGLVIWGATARIMENFMNIVGPNLPLETD